MNLKKYLINENTSDINDVSGDMARLIMGDKNIAINSLKKSLPLNQAKFKPGEGYNKAFSELIKDISMAIKKALKSIPKNEDISISEEMKNKKEKKKMDTCPNCGRSKKVCPKENCVDYKKLPKYLQPM